MQQLKSTLGALVAPEKVIYKSPKMLRSSLSRAPLALFFGFVACNKLLVFYVSLVFFGFVACFLFFFFAIGNNSVERRYRYIDPWASNKKESKRSARENP